MKNISLIILIAAILSSCKGTVDDIAEKISVKSAEKSTVKSVARKSSRVLNHVDPTRPYNRDAVNTVFIEVKRRLHKEGLERGMKENRTVAVFTDAYTGKKLFGGLNYEFDHVRSAEYIHTKYKALLTDEEIAAVVNCDGNVIATATNVNRAKGKRHMEYLLDDSEKMSKLGIDCELALQTIKDADLAIQRKVQEILILR